MAAERDVEQIEGISADWGKVCVLKNPKVDVSDPVLQSWFRRVTETRPPYTSLPAAEGEEAILDPATGLAPFDWPKDVATNEALTEFDLLLMTANKPTLIAGHYPTVGQIAAAWQNDVANNVMYFYNNRYCGITTFEDEAIQTILRGATPGSSPTSAAESSERHDHG